LAAVAVAAAVVLGSLPLNPHGHEFLNMGGLDGHIHGPAVIWTGARAAWQIPVAVVIAVLGIGAAVAVANRRSPVVPIASK
jgi:hypothetical protein